jgi:signal transduction histidine kinase
MQAAKRYAAVIGLLLYAGLFLVLGVAVLALFYALAATSSHMVAVQARPASHPALLTPTAAGASNTTAAEVPTLPKGPIRATVVQHEADLAWLLRVSLLELVLVSAGALVLGWFAAERMLRPLRAITATAPTVSAGNLHERLALAGPDDEFKRLGDTLDDLLARLEASFEAQRRFVANDSHELRTPLTLERTLLWVPLADPDASAHAGGLFLTVSFPPTADVRSL